MDHSRHSVTKYLIDEKTHVAISSKLLKKLNHVNKVIFEVELTKAEIEHKKPNIVGLPIFQYAKLRIMELYYNQ